MRVTLESLFLTLVAAYLALIGYGVVGARRRLAGRSLLVAEVLMVVLPPLLIAGALAAGEGELLAQWWRLFALMIATGAVVAAVAEQVARRVQP